MRHCPAAASVDPVLPERDRPQQGGADPEDLRSCAMRTSVCGGARAARRFVGLQTFFDFADREAKPNERPGPSSRRHHARQVA
jgi:hypothetical protein